MERLVDSARSHGLTSSWAGKAIPLEHPTIDWLSFCRVYVLARAPRRTRKKKTIQSPAVAMRTSRMGQRLSPRVHATASVELLINIIRVVTRVSCEQLDDPYGSGRRFALMELD